MSDATHATTTRSTVDRIANAIEAVEDGGIEEVGDVEIGRTRASKPVRLVRINKSKPVRFSRVNESKPIRGEGLDADLVREAVAEIDGADAADHVQKTGDGVVTYHKPAA